MVKQIGTFLLISILVVFSSTTPVESVEIVITDNGNSSANQVTVSTEVSTSVSQENSSSIENHVETNANTGENTASANTGGTTTIETGSIAEQVLMTNQANQSTTDISCCTSDPNSSMVITGNGENSNNVITASLNSQNSITITQQAIIQNNVNGKANTGSNNANNNNGNIHIQTGDITLIDKTVNKNINTSSVKVKIQRDSMTMKIAGNGPNSKNSVTISQNSQNSQNISHRATITNNNFWNVTTGKNKVDRTNGSVAIKTGDISAYIAKVNDGINVSTVDVSCCKEKDNDEHINPPPPPPPTPTPPPPPPGNGYTPPHPTNGSDKGNGGAGQVLGTSAVGGMILPITGTSWWLFATIANIFMFLFGLYLRMRAGRSPCYANTK